MSWDCAESALVCFSVAFQWDTSSCLSFHPPNPLSSSGGLCFAAGLSPHRRLHFFFLLPCDIVPFCLFVFFVKESFPSLSFIPNFRGLLSPLTLSKTSTLFLPLPRWFSVVYTHFLHFSVSLVDLNASPPSLHPCFLAFSLRTIWAHLSLLSPFIVCHSLSFHPSFFHLNFSQGDLGRAHQLSSPAPSVPFEISEAPFLS